ncbi:glycosyltransferase [Flavobacterium sp. WG21]|uniref:glycosyltransferase n=1 Tax=Flavobacterium sp. WG21 TaxID=1229487 RepID=UPI000347DEE0|nr:glycosyltransferase [Flavobacterium sp. WG21]
MKKTIFVVASLDSGGIENYLLRFLRFFENKIEPTVICRGNHFGELESEYRKISNINLVKMDLTRFEIKNYYKFYSFLKDSKADSFVDFTGSYAGVLMLLANMAGIKIRNLFYRGSSHDFEPTFLKTLYVDSLKVLGKLNATKILSNSNSALDFYFPKRNLNDLKFKVIYNGIDATKMIGNKYNKCDFGIPSDGFIIGHTGRYNRAKNHETIIKVAERICVKYDNIYFVLCGKNTDVYLAKQIEDSDVLKRKVKLLGYRDDVPSILTIFDLYFFPSITEGQPNALIEAMVSGLPIIASNIGPIIETVPEVLHNELVNPLDVDCFCNLIEEYYVNNLKRSNSNFSEWAIKRFSSSELFNEFFMEL